MEPQARDGEIRGRIAMLKDLQELTVDDMRRYYAFEEVDAGSGTQADQGPAR
jgi:hypothetical protein